MDTFTIRIESKEYTKEELIAEVVKTMQETLPEGTYVDTPIDPDNFHTKYEIRLKE